MRVVPQVDLTMLLLLLSFVMMMIICSRFKRPVRVVPARLDEAVVIVFIAIVSDGDNDSRDL